MTAQDSYDWPDEESVAPECIECGAEATIEQWADEGGHSVWLCEDCANPTCFVCGMKIEGRPITGWHDGLGETVKLCTRCAQKAEEIEA
jgi:hypothetical protein